MKYRFSNLNFPISQISDYFNIELSGEIHEIIYDPEKLTEGENEIICPICNKKFIRIFDMAQIRLLKQKALSSSHEEAR